MKTRRLAEWAMRAINESEHGRLNTHEIREHINNRTQHGTTTNSLTNVLAKSSAFKKIDTVRTTSILNGGYDIAVWAITEQLDNPYTRHLIKG
jgi:hypothetical protein